jgi:acylphosphatase
MKSVEIKIKGKVQGVGFRYHTYQKANELNIKGFVQNMPDKSVFIMASGTNDALDTFIQWCHFGPKWAIVDSVQVIDIAAKEHDSFNIR